MITQSLTGALRYRAHHRWWYSQPLVVVQVQVSSKGYRVGQYGAEEVDELFWRDATVGDVTRFAAKGDRDDA